MIWGNASITTELRVRSSLRNDISKPPGAEVVVVLMVSWGSEFDEFGPEMQAAHAQHLKNGYVQTHLQQFSNLDSIFNNDDENDEGCWEASYLFD